ncbi:MAG: tRNA threonylcarbamoyladenosine dehydratase [Pseudomonadota bacterium]
MDQDTDRRFLGIQKLYGHRGYQQIVNSHVCIIGIGGVGSWVAESLARSHVNQITLIDLDHIAESNINRQIHALTKTLGQSKINAMEERIHGINAECTVHTIDEHLSINNIANLINKDFTYVVDCIDNFRIKAALIHYCRSNKIKLITVGGAGGRIDPSCIQIADLTRAEGDSLLAKTRKQLRTQHGFPRNLQRRFDIACVYSTETQRYPTDDNEISTTKAECSTLSGLNCANGFGSLSAVTATFGMLASAHVLNKIASTDINKTL